MSGEITRREERRGTRAIFDVDGNPGRVCAHGSAGADRGHQLPDAKHGWNNSSSSSALHHHGSGGALSPRQQPTVFQTDQS